MLPAEPAKHELHGRLEETWGVPSSTAATETSRHLSRCASPVTRPSSATPQHTLHRSRRRLKCLSKEDFKSFDIPAIIAGDDCASPDVLDDVEPRQETPERSLQETPDWRDVVEAATGRAVGEIPRFKAPLEGGSRRPQRAASAQARERPSIILKSGTVCLGGRVAAEQRHLEHKPKRHSTWHNISRPSEMLLAEHSAAESSSRYPGPQLDATPSNLPILRCVKDQPLSDRICRRRWYVSKNGSVSW